MTTVQQQLARAQRFIALQAEAPALMMKAMPGQVTPDVAAELKRLHQALEQLAAETPTGEQLTPRTMVEERVADLAEWVARASDALGDTDTALEYYQRAAAVYERLGNGGAIRRVEERTAELRLHVHQDIDAEHERLSRRLEEVAHGTIEHALALISLGELTSRAGDDHGALRWLLAAEEILDRPPFRLPDAASTVRALDATIGVLRAGGRAGETPIEQAMLLRSAHQRLLFGLASACRTLDPARAEQYEARLAALDADGRSGESDDALLGMFRRLLD